MSKKGQSVLSNRSKRIQNSSCRMEFKEISDGTFGKDRFPNAPCMEYLPTFTINL